MSEEQNISMKVIGEINSIPGFNPDEFVQQITDENTGRQFSHLPVRIQKAWFRLKYPEGKITVTPFNIDYEKKSAVFYSRVYANKNDPEDAFLSEAYGVRDYDEKNPNISFIEWAQTAAEGKALSDAGFGLKFDHSGDVPNGTETNPKQPTAKAEQPKKTENTPATGSKAQQPNNNQTPTSKQPEAPKASTSEQTSQVSIPVKPAEKPVAQAQETQPQAAQTEEVMTYEMAKTFTVPFGANAGKTLGEIAVNHPDDIQWMAEKYNGSRNPQLKKAAQIVWNKAKAA